MSSGALMAAPNGRLCVNGAERAQSDGGQPLVRSNDRVFGITERGAVGWRRFFNPLICSARLHQRQFSLTQQSGAVHGGRCRLALPI